MYLYFLSVLLFCKYALIHLAANVTLLSYQLLSQTQNQVSLIQSESTI